LLELKKYNLLSADNLMEGLNYILKYPLDLVILDSEFDNNEQYQLCRIFRNTDNFKDILIIFLVKLKKFYWKKK
jgi:DNA-binding response OmpR family regulator